MAVQATGERKREVKEKVKRSGEDLIDVAAAVLVQPILEDVVLFITKHTT